MIIELIIFRHGQTEGNVRDLIVGNRESELTDIGREQAEKIGKELYIRHRHFDAFFSSPLSRARNTTAIVAGQTNYQNNIIIKEDLHELDTGDFSMLSREEAKKIDGLGNFNEKVKDECYECPNGESAVECRERFHRCIMEICQESERNGHQVIGIGAHSFVMRQLLIKCNFPNISELSNCEMIKCAYNTESKTIEVLERIIARDQVITM